MLSTKVLNSTQESTSDIFENNCYSLVELIDDYIDMMVDYDDAYAYAVEDFEKQQLRIQQELADQVNEAYAEPVVLKQEEQEAIDANTKDLLVKLAVARGFSEPEAQEFVRQMYKAIETKGYAKAYQLFLSRLES
jgi:hypothetical protein